MQGPKRVTMTKEELDLFFERLERDELTDSDRKQIKEVMRAVIWMGDQLENKELSIKRLQRLFGVKTETAANVLGGDPNDESKDKTSSPTPRNRSSDKTPKGKNGRDDYPDAECIYHEHETLKPGDICPLCGHGTLYHYGTGTVLRLTGQPPITAVIHEPEQLRCSGCQELFTAAMPEDAGTERADASAKSMIALFRYGAGIPFYRMEKLQAFMQTPVPDSTQWDMSESIANHVYPVYRALLYEAAQSELFHSDDTGMRILQLKKKLKSEDAKRQGIYTTGILALASGREIALFFTGNKHAGERMEKILKTREAGRVIPKMMCDALASNTPKETTVQMANCMDHARRGFIDIEAKYKDEVGYFIKKIGEVYLEDRKTKSTAMTDEERLTHHKKHSSPIMNELKVWCETELSEKRVEPNSPLGSAMNYFLNHFEKLNLFTEVPGIPLSNAAVERLLKTAVLHRKNSLFYLTETGAIVGDIMMSLIQTAKRSQVNVLDYLTQLQTNSADVKLNPNAWLPWNYQERIGILHSKS